MKLAEALAQRADVVKQIADLRGRLQRSAVSTEGDEPAENVRDLLEQLTKAASQFEILVVRINRTNLQTEVADGETITDLLARRDALNQVLPILQFLIAHTSNALNQHRAMRSELRAVTHVNISEIQKQIDSIGAALRQIDNRIQEQNWLTELL